MQYGTLLRLAVLSFHKSSSRSPSQSLPSCPLTHSTSACILNHTYRLLCSPEAVSRASQRPKRAAPSVIQLDIGSINRVTGLRSADTTLPGTNLCYLLAAESMLTGYPAPRQVWLRVVSVVGDTARHELFARSTISTTVTAGMPCRFEMASETLEVLHSLSISALAHC